MSRGTGGAMGANSRYGFTRDRPSTEQADQNRLYSEVLKTAPNRTYPPQPNFQPMMTTDWRCPTGER